MNKGHITVVLGLQRGDEGKGRFVDELAESHDIVARFNGGPNAGHTVLLPNGKKLDLHVVPSGVAHQGKINVVGNGCFVDPVKLCAELDQIQAKGIKLSEDSLYISRSAHVILPSHVQADVAGEKTAEAQGTTQSGIAPVAADKYRRVGTTMGQLADDEELLTTLPDEYTRAMARLTPMLRDTTIWLNQALESGKKVLAEGAQAFLLDIDHGMYPYVTSSSTTTGGVCTGLGVSPQYVERVIGVVKATQSHVGGGPFVTEIEDVDVLQTLRGEKKDIDGEFGTTTGRARRMGYLDLPGIRRACMVNGATELALTKLDCAPRFGKTIPICHAYEPAIEIAPASAQELAYCAPVYTELDAWSEDISDVREYSKLPAAAKKYIEYLEQQLCCDITRIGVGPSRDQVILCD